MIQWPSPIVTVEADEAYIGASMGKKTGPPPPELILPLCNSAGRSACMKEMQA